MEVSAGPVSLFRTSFSFFRSDTFIINQSAFYVCSVKYWVYSDFILDLFQSNVAHLQEFPCRPPAGISLLTCGVSYHLFLYTAPLWPAPVFRFTVGCNPIGLLLRESWEWDFMSLINTQCLEVRAAQQTDNYCSRQSLISKMLHFAHVRPCILAVLGFI